MKYFFSAELDAAPFKPFALPHLMAIITLFILIAVLYYCRKILRKEKVNLIFRYFLITELIIAEGSIHLWRYLTGQWSIQESLPLHLCGIGIICSIIMLYRKSQLLFELTYFWGLIGAFLAMVTPDLTVDYTHFRFWQFFGAHGSIIMAVMFMIFVEGYRPVARSIKKTFLVTNAYLFFIAVFNYFTGANYLYICEKPGGSAPTLLDLMGPWPWYVLSLEFLAIFAFLLAYLPYFIQDRRVLRGTVPMAK